MSSPIRLIVGLGNPGSKYEKTRHNAGVWFVEHLIQNETLKLTSEKKFKGLVGKVSLFHHECFILVPTTYMNNSGEAVSAIAKFYKISPEEIIIAHDELDLPVGVSRLKEGGGTAGHNGLNSVVSHLGSKDFVRIRIGIGHPKVKEDMLDYVLSRPTKAEQEKIKKSIDEAIQALPLVLEGELEKAMNQLHGLSDSD